MARKQQITLIGELHPIGEKTKRTELIDKAYLLKDELELLSLLTPSDKLKEEAREAIKNISGLRKLAELSERIDEEESSLVADLNPDVIFLEGHCERCLNSYITIRPYLRTVSEKFPMVGLDDHNVLSHLLPTIWDYERMVMTKLFWFSHDLYKKTRIGLFKMLAGGLIEVQRKIEVMIAESETERKRREMGYVEKIDNYIRKGNYTNPVGIVGKSHVPSLKAYLEERGYEIKIEEIPLVEELYREMR